MIFAAGLGFVVLGPKRMQALLAQVARAKGELNRVRQTIATELEENLDTGHAAPAPEEVCGSDSSVPAA